jgi:uncharacterized protein
VTLRQVAVPICIRRLLPLSKGLTGVKKMSIRDKLSNDMKDAMKSGDKRKLATIRLMNAAIKQKDIDTRTEGHDSEKVSDTTIMDVLAKMVKQRQDSIVAYEQGGRAELAQQEREEMDIIQSYMPKQMDEAEAKQAIAVLVKDLGASSIKDMGKVMAELKSRYSGQIDMAKAGGIVKSLLG